MALLQVYSGLTYPNSGPTTGLSNYASSMNYGTNQGFNGPFTTYADRAYQPASLTSAGADPTLNVANNLAYYSKVGPTQRDYNNAGNGFAAGVNNRAVSGITTANFDPTAASRQSGQYGSFAPNKYSYYVDGRGNSGLNQPRSVDLITNLASSGLLTAADANAFQGTSAFYDYFNQYFVKQATLYGNADNITQLGFDFYWLAFGFHLAAMFVFGYLTVFHGKESRRLHVLTVAIAVTGASVYYAFARAQGGVALPNDAATGYRVFYWARYLQWAATTPALVYVLGLLAGASLEAIIAGVVSAEIFVATRLFGALSSNASRWGWFSFACASQLVLFGILFAYFRPAAYRKSDSRGYATTIALFFMLAAWFPYLTIWVIGEGTRAITVDAEILLYAIFDVYKQLVFSAVVLFSEPIYGLLSTTSADILESKL